MVKKTAMGIRDVALILCVGGCGVPAPPSPTGPLPAGTPLSGCAAPMAVVCSDFTASTNIAIVGHDGSLLSGSFVSTASTPPGAAATALSGDVELPYVAPLSGRLVVIDRMNNVLTWMDPFTRHVLAQLSVATGFPSNPHDYVEVDASHALVTRYATNPNPGQQTFDTGGDVLVVDPTTFGIVASIAMPAETAPLQPSPDTMNRVGSEVVVTLGRISADFKTTGDGRLVGISPTALKVDWTLDLPPGLKTCGRLVTSPSGALAAIACSGTASANGTFDPKASDIVVYDATTMPPSNPRALGLGASLGSAVQPEIAFFGENALLALTYGGGAAPGDTVIGVDVAAGAAQTLASSTMPFVLNGVRCNPGCDNLCFVTDAEANVLRRWQVRSTTAVMPLPSVKVDPSVGLPPRDLGGL